MPLGYEKDKKANAKSRVGEHEEGLWSPEIAWEMCKNEQCAFYGQRLYAHHMFSGLYSPQRVKNHWVKTVKDQRGG